MNLAEETTVFTTERLLAVAWRRAHAEEAFRMYGDPEVGRYIGGHRESLADVEAMLEMILERGPTLPKGMGSYPLALAATGELVGTALIKPLPDANDARTDDIEIGWHLMRAHWGSGYATEAGRALCRWAFEELDLDVIHAVVQPPNTASIAVTERLGMEPQGLTTAYYGGRELFHFVLRRAEWSARG